MKRCYILFFLFLGLVGCGFQPRGAFPLAPPLYNLYIQSCDPYGRLTRYIKQYLKASHVHVTCSPQTATTVLHILQEDEGQQLLSVGGTQQTRQYNLTLTVSFQITNACGVVLVPTQLLSQSRVIPIQVSQVLGGSNEANILYNQMRRDIAFDLMNRLASNCVTQTLMTHP